MHQIFCVYFLVTMYSQSHIVRVAVAVLVAIVLLL